MFFSFPFSFSLIGSTTRLTATAGLKEFSFARRNKHDQDWKQIYPQCIPNYSILDPAVRRQAESNLRAAIRARRNAARRRKQCPAADHQPNR